MAGDRKLTVVLAGDSRGMEQAVGKAQKSLGDFGSKFAGFAKTAALGLGGAALAAGAFAKSAIDDASELGETLSKSNTVFGTQAKAIENWADKAASGFGQSKQQALAAASSFGNMFSQLGIGDQKAADMSKQMTELASDFASFHNADITEVLEAQQAAFRGEYDSLQKFVPTINAAAVEQEALRQTGKKTTKELTAQEKALATQTLMMKGAGDAMGDFDRTSDSLANRQRILGARFADIKAKIGTGLMPVAVALADFVATKLLPGIARLGDALAPVGKTIVMFWNALRTGFTEDEGTPIENFALMLREKVLPVVLKIADFIKNNLKPILIGLAAAFVLITSPISAVIAAAVLLYTRFGVVRTIVGGVVQFLTGTVIPAIAAFASAVNTQFQHLVEWVRTNWAGIQEAIGHVTTVIKTIITGFVAVVSAMWRMWGDNIMTIVKAVFAQVQTIIKVAVAIVSGVIKTAVALINGDWGKAWSAFKGIFSNAFKAVVDGLRNGVKVLVSIVSGIGELVGRAARGVFDGLKSAFKGAVNFIIRKWNDLSFKIGGQKVFGQTLPGVTINTPNIPTLAAGGIVKSRPGGILANIGEGRYDEAVVPLDGRHGLGGGGITIDLRGAIVASNVELESTIENAVRRVVGRKGYLPGTNIVRTSVA